MTRCFRLPAPRGAITDRHGAPLAVNAVDVGSGRGPGARGPRPAARPAGGRRTGSPQLTGRPAADLGSQIRAAAGTTLSLPVADVPRAAGERGDRGSDSRRAGRRGAAPEHIRRARCSGRCSASPGWPRRTTRQRWPGLPPGEIVGRAGLEQEYDAVLRGVDGRQCVYVDPAGVPVALGERQDPVPGADLRLSLDLGLQRQLDAGLAAARCARSPGRAARSARPSRWIPDPGRSSPS